VNSVALQQGRALGVERAERLSDADIADLAEATDAAIIEGGGFGWVEPQGRAALERHFRGVLLVPERELFVARLDGHAVGSALLVRPPRNNEAQAFAATLTHAYIAPYARGFGLARRLVEKVEERAASLGHRVLNLDVRETQATAIALFESLGYVHWGTHPYYARVKGQTVAGRFYFKTLEPGRGRPTGDLIDGAV
jgi:ribosomal protein S18 acetylase RimI-like enzyme